MMDGKTGTQLTVQSPGGGNVPAANGSCAVLKQAMIRDLPKKDVFNMVLMSVARTFADMNVKDITDDERSYLVNELTDNLISRHPSMRLMELPEAFAQGIRGKYGQFFGLSVVTFERFAEQYLLSDKRTGMVKQLPADEPPKPVPDVATQFSTGKYNTLQALQRRREGRDTASMASSVYHFLDSLGLINFTAAEKYDMMDEATCLLIKELQLKLLMARESERTAIRQDIDAYTAAINHQQPVNGRQVALVRMKAKSLALDAFLNNILLEGTDLVKLLEEKKAVFDV